MSDEKEPVKITPDQQAFLDQIKAIATKVEAFIEKQGWITPGGGSVLLAVISVVLMIGGSLWFRAPPAPSSVDLSPVLKQMDANQKELLAAIASRPAPVPVPVPVDTFQSKVQAAYVADGKPAELALLAALYRQSGPTVNNVAFTKSIDVLAAMHQGAQTLIGDKLPSVRRALADEFNAGIGGKTGTVLTPAIRATIAAEFKKAQTALENVK